MKKFYYYMSFSPYMSTVRAKNKREAWRKIIKMWPEYDCNKAAVLV